MTDLPARPTPVDADALPATLWSTPVTIRFGHCDPAGIVYTPQYFHLFNGVIEAWYEEALGFSYYALIGERRLGLGYASAACDFFAPSRMGETLRVAVVIERIGRSSMTLRLHALKGSREVARGRFVSVATDLDTHAVLSIPADLRAAYERYHAATRAA